MPVGKKRGQWRQWGTIQCLLEIEAIVYKYENMVENTQAAIHQSRHIIVDNQLINK